MPNNKTKMIWDWYVVILLIYTALLVPYIVCFNISREDSFSWNFDLAIDGSFIIDIFLTFFQAIEHQDLVIVDRCCIAKTYIKGWFFIDLFTTIPFQLIDVTFDKD